MTRSKDYYHILGVEKSASAEEIKRAYRRLAVKHHPDHNLGDKEAEEKFKLISEAYAVLIDENKRAQYDRVGTGRPFEAGTQQKNGRTGEGFTYTQEEIFREFFAGAYARQAFRDMAQEFKKSGFRFDDKFFNRVFFGGKGFFFGGVFFSGPDQERVQRDVRPDYRTTFSKESRRAASGPSTQPVIQKRPKKGLLSRLGQGALTLARAILPDNSAPLDLTGRDINFNLNITREQARKGADLRLVYQRGGKSQEVSVKVPAGTRNGSRLRLKSMGEMVPGGTSGDLFLHVRVN